MSTSDLQPKKFKIKIHEKEYWCKPPRLSHRLIIARIQPLFVAIEGLSEGKPVEITAEEMMSYETDLDIMIQSLIPELNNIELDVMDIAEIVGQIMQHMLPEDSKELKEANVEFTDPKVESKEKN